MADFVWTGATNDDFNTATNFDTGGAPTGAPDTIICNDQSANPIATNTNQGATEDYSFIIEPGFNFYVGTSGNPFICDDMAMLMFAGSGIASSYFNPADLTRCVVDSKSTKDDVLVLNPTASCSRVMVKNGKMSFGATSVLSSSVISIGQPGTTSTAEVTIPSGATMTSTTLIMYGGKCTLNKFVSTIFMAGGQLILDGASGSTAASGGPFAAIYQSGGEIIWDSAGADATTNASIITSLEITGGLFRTRKNRKNRTVTTMNVYGGKADFSVGGHAITFTNAPRDWAGGSIIYPKGASVTKGL